MMGVKLSFHFVVVMYMCTVARFCYGNGSRFPSYRVKNEVKKLLHGLNKPPVKSIKSPDGDIIDCVHISHQPAFDHPLLKNRTIKMRPDYHPNRMNVDDIRVSSMTNASKNGDSSSSITQLWHSNGKCPKGTVPIRRTKKEDVLRAETVKSYAKKKSFSVAHPSSIDVELDVSRRYEFAYAYTRGELYGTKATLNLWNPKVQESNEYSLAQIWIVGGDLDTIEAGWQVDPGLYGDTNTRLFVYWTNDGFKRKGCFNLECSGFIQTSNKIAVGASLSPTSIIHGFQYDMTISVWKDPQSGDWWMHLGNEEYIGYWPSELFSQLNGSASLIEWGGAVANSGSHGHHTTTEMGSGQFPNQGFKKASYIKNIEIVDASDTFRTTPDFNLVRERGCYEISTPTNHCACWGAHFFYGGPGRNENCP